jgi:hypothetical protein
MRRTFAELATAQKEEAELQAKLDRLNAVVADAEAADAAFHKAVAADDDGAALAEFAQGNAPGGMIANLIGRAQTTAAAAVAARAAAPKVQARLETLREQITSLEYEKKQAQLAYLAGRASDTFRQFSQPWEALCRAYDQVAGIRRALEYGRALEPIQGPRFDDTQFLTTKHTGDSELARRTQAKWQEARKRLDADPDADVTDLIGCTPQEGAFNDSKL